MSTGHRRRAGKYGEDDDGNNVSGSLPPNSKPSPPGSTSNSSKATSSTAPSSKLYPASIVGVGAVDDEGDVSTLSNVSSSISRTGAANGGTNIADYKMSLQEEQETSLEKVEEENLKPAATTDVSTTSPSVASTIRGSRHSATNDSLYPDLGDMKNEDVPSEQYKDFMKETSNKKKRKKRNVPPRSPPPPSQEDAGTTTTTDPTLRKVWPPVPPPSNNNAPTVAQLPLSEEERAAKDQARGMGDGSNNRPTPAITPGARMVPGVRSTEPWIPNNDEEDPDLKSLNRSNADMNYAGSSDDSEDGRKKGNGDDDDGSNVDSELSDEESGIIKATMVVEDQHVPEAEAVSERGLRRRRRIIVCIALLCVIGIVVGLSVGLTRDDSSSTVFVETTPAPTGITPAPTSSPTETPRPTLETVVDSGVLRCGVTDKKGFSIANVITGQRDGFDIDLCRAVAAAVLGDSNAIETTVLSGSERFIALRDREVDMLARVTTHTMERDVYEKNSLVGFSFAAPYLYDGLGFGGLPEFVDCADQLTTFGRCVSLSVCVLESTTHLDVLGQRLPQSALKPVDSRATLYKSLIDGDCNVIAGEQFDVAEQVVRDAGYTGLYQVGTNLFSKEPLALVVRKNDEEWYNFVSWVFEALIAAEEAGIARLTAGQFPTTMLFGEQFQNMFQNALAAVGNYGEMYARHLEPIVPREGLNTINTAGTTGLIYSFPFGTLSLAGREPEGIINTVITRGQLRCGIIQRPASGILLGNNQWNGADADYCRAVAAGLFGTTTPGGVVEFVEVTDNANGLLALAGGEVDVFAGGAVTFERDVRDPGAGEGFTYTTPYFYYPTTLPPNSQYGETLSLVTVQEDPEWADFCFWIVHGTFFAAEQDIRQSEFGLLPQVQLFGRSFEDMLRNAVGAVGNWGEVYARSVEPVLPMTNSSNQLNLNPVGPQLYPLPGLI